MTSNASHARHQRRSRFAVERLRDAPGAAPTRHRKPLDAPIDELGSTAWELRVGPFRAFFSIDDEVQTVTVLRVILKDRWTTVEALGRSRRS